MGPAFLTGHRGKGLKKTTAEKTLSLFQYIPFALHKDRTANGCYLTKQIDEEAIIVHVVLNI